MVFQVALVASVSVVGCETVTGQDVEALPPCRSHATDRMAVHRFEGQSITQRGPQPCSQLGEHDDLLLPLEPDEDAFLDQCLDDLAGTTFYIQQATGQIVTRRHNVWRAFDWMWRLHIMDYDDGENVANPLLLVLAVLAIVAIISGILLLACRFLSVSPPGSNTLNALNKGGHND